MRGIALGRILAIRDFATFLLCVFRLAMLDPPRYRLKP